MKNRAKKKYEQLQHYTIAVVNFADSNYRSAQNLNTKTALSIGHADVVYSFSPADIDQDFYKKHENIFRNKRGAGMWLWKPYFVNMVLKKLEDGDYLFYCDSGAFFIGNIRKILEKLPDFSILCFDIPLIEEQFTQKRTFDFVDKRNDKYTKTNQIIGTYFIIKKNSFTTFFIKEWLNLCCNETFLLAGDSKGENDSFISHREDQSIFSLLCKKYNIVPYKDISQRRWFPYSYKYDKCEFKTHKYHLNLPVILYLHKMKKVKFYPILRQILNHLGSWVRHHA